jgi:hypothetical protein
VASVVVTAIVATQMIVAVVVTVAVVAKTINRNPVTI